MKGEGVLILQGSLRLIPGEQASLTLTAPHSSAAPTVMLGPVVPFLHTSCDSPE